MFSKVKKITEKFKSINESFILDKLSKDENLKENIIYYNTQEQLYQRGIDSDGKTLGQYSIYTKGVKQSKGQPFDHITLRDTGAFYNSFRVLRTLDGLLITADSIKDDKDLRVEYGSDIVGLTDQSLSKVIKEARVKTVIIIKSLFK